MATNKPDLTRVWANGAPPSNVVDPDTTTPGKVAAGWQAEVPPFEHFNFLQKWFTQGLAHVNEQGIMVWDTNTTYPSSGLVKGSSGKLFISQQEQSGNDPESDDGSNWQPWNNFKGIKTLTDTIVDTSAQAGDYVRISDRGYGLFLLKTLAQATSDGDILDDVINIELDNGLWAILQLENKGVYPVDQCGGIVNALDNVPEGSTILLAKETYDIIWKYYLAGTPAGFSANRTKNLTLQGSGTPTLSDDGTRFIDGSGTVIQGTLLNLADGFECYDLGVDVGSYVVDTLSGGSYHEGFIPATTDLNPLNTWDNLDSYIDGVKFDNIKVLMKKPIDGNSSTYRHACLFEHAINGWHGNIECISGYFGYVVKAVNTRVDGAVWVWGQFGTGGASYIFKADAYSQVKDYFGGKILIGKKGADRTIKAFFQAALNVPFDNVSFDVAGNNCTQLVAWQDAGATEMTNVNIKSIMCDDANLIVATIPAIAKNWTFGTHNITNSLFGIVSEAGCENCHIDSGFVDGASNGYTLSGDVTHGVLTANNSTSFGINNVAAQINPERVKGSGNGGLNLSNLYDASSNFVLTNGWVAGTTGFSVTEYDNQMITAGELKSGTNDVVTTIPAGKRPRVNLILSAAANDGTSAITLPIVVDAASGVVTVVGGAAAMATGGWVSFSNVKWGYGDAN